MNTLPRNQSWLVQIAVCVCWTVVHVDVLRELARILVGITDPWSYIPMIRSVQAPVGGKRTSHVNVYWLPTTNPVRLL